MTNSSFSSIRPYGSVLSQLQFLHSNHKMSLMKVAWYVLSEKYVFLVIPGPWVHEERTSQATYIRTYFSVSSPPQCWSEAVVCVIAPRMYPQRASSIKRKNFYNLCLLRKKEMGVTKMKTASIFNYVADVTNLLRGEGAKYGKFGGRHSWTTPR